MSWPHGPDVPRLSTCASLIERGLDDMEDYYLAADVLERVRGGREKVYAADDVRNALDLDD